MCECVSVCICVQCTLGRLSSFGMQFPACPSFLSGFFNYAVNMNQLENCSMTEFIQLEIYKRYAVPLVFITEVPKEDFTMFGCQSKHTYIFIWRCPWCNGYRRWIWTRRHEFKSWMILIAFHIALIPLGKV